jgi:hypothetical protein
MSAYSVKERKLLKEKLKIKREESSKRRKDRSNILCSLD